MKTSFYFVIWIAVYPLLGLFHSAAVNENSFVIAFLLVMALSWLLNRLMPDTLNYEHFSENAPILEDVYTSNVKSFSRRLSRMASVETITALYFIVTTIVVGWGVFKAGVNDWFALAVFAFFTIGAIARSSGLLKAKSTLKANPTPEQCMEIAENTFHLDYSSYYELHEGKTYAEMLSAKPKYFSAFRIASIVFAVIAALFGLFYIADGIILMFISEAFVTGTIASMYFLYGSLAAYFGIKDFICCIQSNKKSSFN